MKKQFLHEQHNLQDKAKKPDYQERFADEGNNFNRGGASEKRLFSFQGSTLIFDLRQFLAFDKQSLLQTLDSWKFIVAGEVGTVSRLMRNPKLAEHVKGCNEATRLSLARASDIVAVAKHPKKNSHYRVVEFTCFLQPLETFPNPIFKKTFAFRINVAKPRS